MIEVIDRGNFARKTIIEINGDAMFVDRNLSQIEPHTLVLFVAPPGTRPTVSFINCNLCNCDFGEEVTIEVDDKSWWPQLRFTDVTEEISVIGEDGETAIEKVIKVDETVEVVS